MQANSIKTLSALLIVVVVAGCASKKADDSTQNSSVAPATTTASAADSMSTEGSNFAPAGTAATAGTAVPIGITNGKGSIASGTGFESNPANYTGDVRSRIIYFAFDKSDIPQVAYATLKAHAKHLSRNAGARLTLEGHADERGTPEYNVALSERRAKSVVNFLVLNGAKASQLEVVSYGEEKPAELGHDEVSWAKNRRAALLYTSGQP